MQLIRIQSNPAAVVPLAVRRPLRRPWYERQVPRVLSLETYELCKRAMDLVLALIAAPFAGIVLLFCAVAIRIDTPGAVFFTQQRTGKGGRRFRMYKLRTMFKNAEELKQKYMHLNELEYPDFKITNDPRMTRVGRLLRKTSLDELPQILNVIEGSMSLVGPRPTSFASSTYDLWHTGRLETKPGLTGLWQVSGRNEIGFNDRVRLDIAYQRNRSLWLDIQILVRTVGCVFTGRGAN
jgi:lipopolysaccharide/colanic/teichoic acid biosynthesis glycosyltransferase